MIWITCTQLEAARAEEMRAGGAGKEGVEGEEEEVATVVGMVGAKVGEMAMVASEMVAAAVKAQGMAVGLVVQMAEVKVMATAVYPAVKLEATVREEGAVVAATVVGRAAGRAVVVMAVAMAAASLKACNSGNCCSRWCPGHIHLRSNRKLGMSYPQHGSRHRQHHRSLCILPLLNRTAANNQSPHSE